MVKFSIKGNCYFCNDDKIIEHHISYTPEIAVYLCKKCHSKFHILINEYHHIIKKKDNGKREITMKKLILSDDINEVNDILKIANMDIKRSDKVKMIAEAKCITERHARRILNKLENIKEDGY